MADAGDVYVKFGYVYAPVTFMPRTGIGTVYNLHPVPKPSGIPKLVEQTHKYSFTSRMAVKNISFQRNASPL